MNHRILQSLIAQPILFSFFILLCIPLPPAYTTDGQLSPLQKANERTALTNVTLIDGNGGQPKSNRTLIISEGRISDIFASGNGKIPAGAKIVDLNGHFVIPGLIDTHVHLATRARPPEVLRGVLRSILLGGVTSVRDMGGNGMILRELANESKNGTIAAPRIYFSTFITGNESQFYIVDKKEDGLYVSNGNEPGTTAWFRRIAPDTDIARILSEAKAFGATGIKIHSGVAPALLKRLCLEARRQNLKIWSHAAITPSVPRDAVEAGVEVLSHADMLAFDGVKEMPPLPTIPDYRVKAYEAVKNVPVESKVIADSLKRMKSKNVILEPTLFIMASFAEAAADDSNRKRLKAHFEYACAVTRRAKEIGVELVAGTDAIGGSSPNIHAELQLLVNKGGLTPLEALTAATRNGAKAIGIEKDYGTLEVSKVADLIILTANPAEDIRNTQTVEAVMKNGELFRRDKPMPTPPFAEPPIQTRIQKVENGKLSPHVPIARASYCCPNRKRLIF